MWRLGCCRASVLDWSPPPPTHVSQFSLHLKQELNFLGCPG